MQINREKIATPIKKWTKNMNEQCKEKYQNVTAFNEMHRFTGYQKNAN